MIEITPAPLTQSAAELKTLIEKYISQGFTSIDIDIQEEPFASKATLAWQDAITIVDELDIPQHLSIGWDLKLVSPKIAVEPILDLSKSKNKNFRIYVYSTSQIQFLEDFDLGDNRLGIGFLGKTNLRGVDFLNKFAEIQLMTIKSEKQGDKLDPYLLDRVTEIRDWGYKGLISLDGGVNLNSAEIINAYAKEVRIDRVSVGSYFQKSKDLESSLQKLNIALNIGIDPE